MIYVVCHGECHARLRSDALRSVAKPLVVVTMQPKWADTAKKLELPRLIYREKLKLMQFVLGKHAICLHACSDRTDDSMAMGASMYAMNIPVWEVQ